MSPRGTLPLELVDQAIDELGEAYLYDRDRYRRILDHGNAYEALRACALVSRKWTVRSRAHMFRKVEVRGSGFQPTVTPPASILPYVKELEILCGDPPSVADLLEAFVTAPVERLVIAGGVLIDERACVREYVDTHSATLRTVEFRGCLVSACNITDIVLGRHRLRSLRLVDCGCDELPLPGHPLITDTQDPNTRLKPSELELSIFGEYHVEGIMGMVTRLPYRFSRLDIKHVAGAPGAAETTNALIKANADVVLSLGIHIHAEDMDDDVESEHLFSLEDCSCLSELTLDMEHVESCAVQNSVFILSTLDPARSRCLRKIVLEAWYFHRWFTSDGPVNYEKEEEEEEEGDKKVDWEELDTVLSKLAKASSSARGKRLTFILVVLKYKELISTMRKWLPKLLPRFNEVGLLHVHYGRGSRCQATDDADGCLSHDRPDCGGFKVRSDRE